MKNNKSISLVDGSGFIFRAYYALPQLSNQEGIPIGAVLGFCNMLFRLIESKNTDKIIVIFDTARKTFRNEIYSSYKINRADPPEDLIPQFKLIRDAVDAFDISRIEMEGFEADDLIATYADYFNKIKWNVQIVSSDKDLMQLVKENVSMLDPLKNKIIGKEEVYQKFGVYPEKVVDVQSLAGDSTDNIPGAPGIGIKTAAKLITEYENLEGLLNNYKNIKQNKRREAIECNIDLIKISKQLVTLKKDINIEINENQISDTKINTEKLIEFLDENNFNSLKARILKEESSSKEEANDIKKNYNIISSMRQLNDLIKYIENKDFFAIDTETDSLKPNSAKLVGISLSCKAGEAFYIPVGHVTNKTIKQIELKDLKEKLDPILSDSSIIKIGQNLKYDILVLKNHGFSKITSYEDTMLMSYSLFAGLHNHNLDFLALNYLGYDKKKYKEIVGSGKKALSFAEVDIEKAKTYACEDADITLRLWKVLKEDMVKNRAFEIFFKIENPLINAVASMEENGIKVDKERLIQLSKEFDLQISKLQKQIFSITKKEFNINSTKQLSEILFDELKLPLAKKNKSGGYSTGAEVLDALASKKFKIAELIIEWRELNKLKSTYTNSLSNSINVKTGRIHTSFQMTGAQTGRLSSTDPNLQNIPIKTSNGREIRKSFIAEKNHTLVCFDYSQIELRLLSEIAGIDNLKKAFKNDVDIHRLTASQVFGSPVEKIDATQRRNAKAINFGIIYGQSAFGLSKQLGISRSEAASYIESYFKQYPGIKEYMEETKIFLSKNGYVKTLFGRKINIKNFQDKNPMIRNYALRQAINAPIQGTAADIIKRAMNKFMKKSNHNLLAKVKLILQVHDELVFEMPNNTTSKAEQEILDIMTNAHEPIIKLSVPLKVSVGKGNNWESAH